MILGDCGHPLINTMTLKPARSGDESSWCRICWMERCASEDMVAPTGSMDFVPRVHRDDRARWSGREDEANAYRAYFSVMEIDEVINHFNGSSHYFLTPGPMPPRADMTIFGVPLHRDPLHLRFFVDVVDYKSAWVVPVMSTLCARGCTRAEVEAAIAWITDHDGIDGRDSVRALLVKHGIPTHLHDGTDDKPRWLEVHRSFFDRVPEWGDGSDGEIADW